MGYYLALFQNERTRSVSDVSALVEKLKSSIAYKQFDAPRAADAYAWPILEKMARVQDEAPRPHSQETAPVAQAVTPQEPVMRSLFDRLQAEAPVHRSQEASGACGEAGPFSRYAAPQGVEETPQALSEIFARIGQKAR